MDNLNSALNTERYITLSAHRRSAEEARVFFDRTTADVVTHLNRLESHSMELDAVFKDAICPDSFEFKKDYFVMGGKYGRVLFLREFASYIKDSMINDLTSLNRTMMLSIDIIPIRTDEAVREMQNKLLGAETNVAN